MVGCSDGMMMVGWDGIATRLNGPWDGHGIWIQDVLGMPWDGIGMCLGLIRMALSCGMRLG